MRFVIRISNEEYSKIIKECGAKSHADVKNFLKQKYEINRDFSIWIYDADNYEFVAIDEENKTEYETKVNELEDAITKCEQAEKEFKSRTCKFRGPINCDFCSFHSDCDERWEEGEAE